ncbi:hypothetical protein [Dactylosporangium sp. NPDC005555]|uniref:hypothetical protein n=1 Tax=Dactylosporangium sp. NPDC005555 TaxID=3154889 RepID=UPI0033AC8699
MKANPVPPALAAAAALSLLTACGSTAPSTTASAPPAASGSATGSASAAASGVPVPSGTDPVLAGRRRVVIVPVGSFESILAVDAMGRLTLTDGGTDKGLFVLSPDGTGKHWIKTLAPPSCMGVKNNGAAPLTVVAATCDPAAKGQLFALEQREEQDSLDRPTYAISSAGGVYLRTGRDGLIAEELGDAGPQAAFTFVDNGPAT